MSRLYEMFKFWKTSLFPNPLFSFSKMAKDEISSGRNRILENGVDCCEDDDNFVFSFVNHFWSLSLQTNPNQEKDQNDDDKISIFWWSSTTYSKTTNYWNLGRKWMNGWNGKLEVVIEGFDQCSIFHVFHFYDEWIEKREMISISRFSFSILLIQLFYHIILLSYFVRISHF